VVRGGLGRKDIAGIVTDTERIKNTPKHSCAKTVFLNLNRSTGIIFLLFTGMHFLVWGILRKRMVRVCAGRPTYRPMKWSMIV
jgi:hypothetical protein